MEQIQEPKLLCKQIQEPIPLGEQVKEQKTSPGTYTGTYTLLGKDAGTFILREQIQEP